MPSVSQSLCHPSASSHAIHQPIAIYPSVGRYATNQPRSRFASACTIESHFVGVAIGRELREWPCIKGYLLDTCLTAQDKFKDVLDYFKIKY